MRRRRTTCRHDQSRPRWPVLLRFGAVAFVLALSLGACEAGEEAASTPADGEEGAEAVREDFRVILAGAASDTLRGRAVFGDVVNPRTHMEQLVLKLETGIDYAGGIFIARGSDEMPEAKSYTLVDASQTADSSLGDRFMMAYQEGLLRQLTSRVGTVIFSHVSDTLISGTIEATLRGQIASGRGGDLRTGELHLSGRFAARKGFVGYIVGL